MDEHLRNKILAALSHLEIKYEEEVEALQRHPDMEDEVWNLQEEIDYVANLRAQIKELETEE